MIKRTGILAAAILMVIVAIALRPLPQSEGPVRKPRAADPGPSLAARPVEEPDPPALPASIAPESETAFWGRVGSLLEARPSLGGEGQRTAILEATSRYLGLDRTQAQGFEAVTRQAIREIEDSWHVREAGWLAVSANVGLDPDLREQAEREVQERYESRKRQALEKLEASVGEGPRALRFRERLEEWVDAVR